MQLPSDDQIDSILREDLILDSNRTTSSLIDHFIVVGVTIFKRLVSEIACRQHEIVFLGVSERSMETSHSVSTSKRSRCKSKVLSSCRVLSSERCGSKDQAEILVVIETASSHVHAVGW